jgi:hypothetical protein
MELALTTPPASMPPAAAWPVFDLRSEPGMSQPPLPWASGPQPAMLTRTVSAARPGTGTAAVRVIASQSAWPQDCAARLPDPAATCLQLTQAILEAWQGRRRVQQLCRWFTDQALAGVGSGCGRAAPGQPARLRSVHLQFPAAMTVEAVGIYRIADRTEAMALRLEADDTHWLCTAYETRTGSSH